MSLCETQASLPARNRKRASPVVQFLIGGIAVGLRVNSGRCDAAKLDAEHGYREHARAIVMGAGHQPFCSPALNFSWLFFSS